MYLVPKLFLFALLLLVFFVSSSVASNQVCPTRPFISECRAVNLLTASASSKHQDTTTVASSGFGVNTSIKLCKTIGGEKDESVCTYLLMDVPWQRWRQKLYDTTTTAFKSLGQSLDGAMHAVQVKMDDWLPSVYWRLANSSLVSLLDHWCYVFWNWHQPKDLIVYQPADLVLHRNNNSQTKDLIVYQPPMDLFLLRKHHQTKDLIVYQPIDLFAVHRKSAMIGSIEHDQDIFPVLSRPLTASPPNYMSPLKTTKVSTSRHDFKLESCYYQHLLPDLDSLPADLDSVPAGNGTTLTEFKMVIWFVWTLTLFVVMAVSRLLVMWGQGQLDAPPRPPPRPRRKSKKI